MSNFAEARYQSKRRLRARRFPIEAPISYRTRGEPTWMNGSTVNISRSGVLFRTEKAVEPETMLDMRISFPNELKQSSLVVLLCWGRVVRNERISASGSGPRLAAAMIKCHFISGLGPELPQVAR